MGHSEILNGEWTKGWWHGNEYPVLMTLAVSCSCSECWFLESNACHLHPSSLTWKKSVPTFWTSTTIQHFELVCITKDKLWYTVSCYDYFHFSQIPRRSQLHWAIMWLSYLLCRRADLCPLEPCSTGLLATLYRDVLAAVPSVLFFEARELLRTAWPQLRTTDTSQHSWHQTLNICTAVNIKARLCFKNMPHRLPVYTYK